MPNTAMDTSRPTRTRAAEQVPADPTPQALDDEAIARRLMLLLEDAGAIAGRLQAELADREARALSTASILDAVMRHADDPLAVIDRHLDVTDATPSAAALLDAAGGTLAALLPDGGTVAVRQHMAAAVTADGDGEAGDVTLSTGHVHVTLRRVDVPVESTVSTRHRRGPVARRPTAHAVLRLTPAGAAEPHASGDGRP